MAVKEKRTKNKEQTNKERKANIEKRANSLLAVSAHPYQRFLAALPS